MGKYQVLARKTRPQTFSQVVGQKAIVTILKNAIGKNRVAHAYLFSGIRGVGKTTLARILAKALNCQQPTEDLDPCNKCTSCIEISQSRSLDVLEIDGASNRGIDDIRKINETVFYAPSSGKYKIYIIDEVHMLTKEAFNALLKTLEAPPEKVLFFFATTEVHKVLPTILSRTQKLELQSISEETISMHLSSLLEEQDISFTKEALQLIAKHAHGSLRDSLSLLDQVICYAQDQIDLEIVEKVFGLISKDFLELIDLSIEQGNLKKLLSLIDQLCTSGKDLMSFFEQFIEHIREHLRKVLNDEQSPYQEVQLLFILQKLIEGQVLLQKSFSKRATIEMLLAQIVHTKNMLNLPQITLRLLELEKKLSTPSSCQTALEKEISPPTQPIIQDPPPTKPDTQKLASYQYDNLMRFAEVEIEGIIHKQ